MYVQHMRCRSLRLDNVQTQGIKKSCKPNCHNMQNLWGTCAMQGGRNLAYSCLGLLAQIREDLTPLLKDQPTNMGVKWRLGFVVRRHGFTHAPTVARNIMLSAWLPSVSLTTPPTSSGRLYVILYYWGLKPFWLSCTYAFWLLHQVGKLDAHPFCSTVWIVMGRVLQSLIVGLHLTPSFKSWTHLQENSICSTWVWDVMHLSWSISLIEVQLAKYSVDSAVGASPIVLQFPISMQNYWKSTVTSWIWSEVESTGHDMKSIGIFGGVCIQNILVPQGKGFFRVEVRDDLISLSAKIWCSQLLQVEEQHASIQATFPKEWQVSAETWKLHFVSVCVARSNKFWKCILLDLTCAQLTRKTWSSTTNWRLLKSPPLYQEALAFLSVVSSAIAKRACFSNNLLNSESNLFG